MSTIGSLFVRLGLDIPGFQSDTKRATRLTKQFKNQWQRDFKGMNRSVMNLGRSFGLLAGGAAVAAEFRAITQAGVSMQKMMNTLQVGTGDATGAMSYLRAEADRLGLDLEKSAEAFSKISAAAKGTALEGEGIREIFSSVATASTAMGLSADQTQGALRALEQMISKGNVQAEELRGQLGERLPGAFQLAAKAMGKTTQELNKMLDMGQITATDLLPKLAKVLNDEFGEGAQTASGNAQQQFNRLSTAIFELNAVIADSGVLDMIASMAKGLADMAKAEAEGIKGLQLFIDTLRDAPKSLDATVLKIARTEEAIARLKQRLTEYNNQTFKPLELFGAKPADQYIDELVRLEAQLKKLKETSAEMNKPVEGAGGAKPSGVVSVVDPKEAARQKNQFDKLLESQRNFYAQLGLQAQDAFALDEEVENNRYAEAIRKEQEQFTTLIENKLATDEQKRLIQAEHNLALENLELIHSENIINIKQQEADEIDRIQEESTKKQIKLDKMLKDARLNVASGMFGAMATLMNTGNRKLFEIGKAAAIAETVVSTYAAAQKAYESQMSIPSPDAPVRAAIAAGSAVISGLSRVSAIAGTSFGGGGGGGAGQSSGGTAATPPTSVLDTPQSEQVEQRISRNVTINMADGLMDSRAVRGLIEQIAEESGDMNVRFT